LRCLRRAASAPTQFYDKGCENCPKLDMEGNRPRIEECTTTHFNGCATRDTRWPCSRRVASLAEALAWRKGSAPLAPPL
jgi:hypothetical protein